MLGNTDKLSANHQLTASQAKYSPYDLARILDALYSAVQDAVHWQTFLNLICASTQCRFGIVMCGDSCLGLTGSVEGKAGFGDLSLSDRRQNHTVGNPFEKPILHNRLIGIYSDDDLLPYEGLLRTDYYREYLRPRGLRFATVLVAKAATAGIDAVLLWRSFEQGLLSHESQHLLETLFPHIQRAFEVRNIIKVNQHRASSAQIMIDASATATFLMTKEGRVLHRNAAADALVARGDSVGLVDGAITTFSARSKGSLHSLLAKVGSIPSEQAGFRRHAVTLERRFGEPAVQVIAVALPSVERERTGADIIMVMSDPADQLTYPDQVLQSLYGLSKAESEVANGLLAGHSLEEIGKHRSVSTGTVRQQLKSIMARTGTQRQGELVSLLLRAPQLFSN